VVEVGIFVLGSDCQLERPRCFFDRSSGLAELLVDRRPGSLACINRFS
jgi:hypothetical protein